MVMDTESLIIKDLHNQSTSRDDTILATRRLGGGLSVEGFRSIDGAAILSICSRYGQRFVINFKSQCPTVRIDFREADFSASRAIGGITGSILEDIASIIDGNIVQRSESGNTEHAEIATDTVCSEDLERVLAIQEVLWVRISPTALSVALMRPSDSRTGTQHDIALSERALGHYRSLLTPKLSYL